MKRAGAVPCDTPEGTLRLEHGEWPEPLEIPRKFAEGEERLPLPDFLRNPVDAVAAQEQPLSPSDLGGAKVLPGEALSKDEAMRRGRQIHLLLEHLPGQVDPEAVGRRLLSRGPDRASPEEIPGLVKMAVRILADHPGIFSADSLAEVEISAVLPTLGREMLGKIGPFDPSGRPRGSC